MKPIKLPKTWDEYVQLNSEERERVQQSITTISDGFERAIVQFITDIQPLMDNLTTGFDMIGKAVEPIIVDFVHRVNGEHCEIPCVHCVSEIGKSWLDKKE